jgi:hypothetical protein
MQRLCSCHEIEKRNGSEQVLAPLAEAKVVANSGAVAKMPPIAAVAPARADASHHTKQQPAAAAAAAAPQPSQEFTVERVLSIKRESGGALKYLVKRKDGASLSVLPCPSPPSRVPPFISYYLFSFLDPSLGRSVYPSVHRGAAGTCAYRRFNNSGSRSHVCAAQTTPPPTRGSRCRRSRTQPFYGPCTTACRL